MENSNTYNKHLTELTKNNSYYELGGDYIIDVNGLLNIKSFHIKQLGTTTLHLSKKDAIELADIILESVQLMETPYRDRPTVKRKK